MGQGGSSVAAAHGFSSLFTNPAGFASEDASFILPSLSSWIFADPLRYAGRLTNRDDGLDAVLTEATDGGYGMGAAAGLAYVGRGLGLGLVLQSESFVYGPSRMGLAGDHHTTLALIGGYAVAFDLLGVGIRIGASVRPLARYHTTLTSEASMDLLGFFSGSDNFFSAMNDQATLHGVGLGFDLGLIAEWSLLKVGLAFRDVGGTPIIYKSASHGEVMASLGRTLVFPPGSIASGNYRIPMNVSLGVALDPDLRDLGFPFDLIVHAEIGDLVGLVRDDDAFIRHFSTGAEIFLWDSIALRVGLHQGLLTLGMGLELGLMELNWATFSQRRDDTPDGVTTPGFALDMAFRF